MKHPLLLLIFLTLLSCQPEAEKSATLNGFALDTSIRLKIYGTSDERLLQDSMKEIQRLEAVLSVHHKDSDIDRLSRNAGNGEWVDLQPESLELLQAGLYYYRLSENKLNIAAGPLIDLWGIDPPQGHIATSDELKRVLPFLDLRQLEFNENQARLNMEGMNINLGAVAKGYIADQIKEDLKNKGIESGILNLGGNILLIGSKPGDQPFRIGIQDPLSTRGENLGVMEIRDKSLVTSGDYERYFIGEDGKRYHHILDPSTGFPADSGLHQVTLVTDTSLQGDALSTTLFLLGLEKGFALAQSLENVEAVFVTTDKEVFITPGMDAFFSFNGQDRGYILKEADFLE